MRTFFPVLLFVFISAFTGFRAMSQSKTIFGDAEYNTPECCVYDNRNNCWYIANSGGTDFPGSVISLFDDGTMEYFIDWIEDANGLCLIDNVLYVSNGDMVIFAYDTDTQERIAEYDFSPDGNFKGMDHNRQGTLYVADTGGKIYSIDTQTGSFSVLADDLTPNTEDILYDSINNCLFAVANEFNAPVQEVNCETGEIIDHETPYRFYKGITSDQCGNLFVSTLFAGGRIYKFNKETFEDWELITIGHNHPTIIYYDTETNILAVPNSGSNTVDFYDLTPQNTPDNIYKNSIRVIPNPVTGDHFKLSMTNPNKNYNEFIVTDIHGTIVMEQTQYTPGSTVYTEGLRPGLYFISPVIRYPVQESIKFIVL